MLKSTDWQKFHLNVHNFDSDTQLQEKLHFQKALIITFRLTYNLFGFAEVRIFSMF